MIDFNYTNTSDLIFNSHGKQSNIYHVHGRAKDNNIVLGFSRTDPEVKVQKFCYAFEKKILRVIHNTDVPPYTEICSQKFNLIIFGHSCSEADSYILKRLLSDKNLGTAVVLCFNENSLVSACNNLISILGDDKMDELLSSDGEKGRLYFALRDEEKQVNKLSFHIAWNNEL